MKTTTHILAALALTAATLSLTGCLEETFPESGVTQEQLNQSPDAVEGLNNAIGRQMLYDGYYYCTCGYPGLMMNRDVMVGQLPPNPTGYDYFTWFETDTEIGEEGQTISDWWDIYTGLVARSNLVIRAAEDAGNAAMNPYEGNARAYRAFAYLDMARMYEYKHTGFAALDQQAEQSGIMGLTVPLIDERTTEQEARTNPRAPFTRMYRFILTDLNRALECLAGTQWALPNKFTKAATAGLAARFWIELGSRFTIYPADLDKAIAAEAEFPELDKLGIATADDCYRRAADYARQAITLSGDAPLSQEQWYNLTTGFNTANDAWLFAMSIKKEDLTSSDASWKSFVSFMSPETKFGIAGVDYQTSRSIDARLYTTMPKADWRRATWIDPADAGDTLKVAGYKTILDKKQWAAYPAYTGFKFRPGDKNMSDYNVGSAVDVPLMRVEEMYLIEAEAIAHSQGLAAGKAALEAFLNQHRYTDGSYKCEAATLADFDSAILDQRCIELWGEGLVFFDFKRMEHAVNTAYVGNNFSDNMQFAFPQSRVAPRMTLCFPRNEELQNTSLVNNPNPSGVH